MMLPSDMGGRDNKKRNVIIQGLMTCGRCHPKGYIF